MPIVNPDIDWAYALSLYIKGMSGQEIATQCGCNLGTLKSRISRERWMDKRANAINAVQLAVTERATKQLITAKNNDLQRTGERVRTRVADAVEKLASDLGMRDVPRKLEKANIYADTLQKAVKTASITFGWEQSGPAAVIIAGDMESIRNQVESIDVQEVESKSLPDTSQSDTP